MARDSELIITASLDTGTTISNIEEELKDIVQPALAGVLRIDCSINSKSISAMKNQLSEITKGLALDVSRIRVADVNTSAIQQNINNSLANVSPQIQISPQVNKKALNRIEKELFLNLGNKKDTQDSLRILEEYVNALAKYDTEKATSELRNFQEIVEKTTRSFDIGKENIKAYKQELRSFISDGSKVYVPDNILKDVARNFGYKGITQNSIRPLTAGEEATNKQAMQQARSVLSSVFGGVDKVTYNKNTNAPDIFQFLGNSSYSTFAGKFSADADGIMELYELLNSSSSETVKEVANLQTIYETLNKILNLPTDKFSLTGDGSIWANLDSVTETDKQINKLTDDVSKLNQVKQQGLSDSDLINNAPQQFANTANVIEKVIEDYAKLGEQVKSVYVTDITAPNGQIESFTAKVTESSGAVRDFKYNLEDVGNGIMAFNLKSTKGNNAGIEKQLQQNAKIIDQYTSKVNNLKSQMGEDFTKGFSSSFESFNNVLKSFGSNTATVEEVRHSFVILENEIKTAKSLLRSGDKSLNEFDNARTSARELSITLTQIQTDFKNLSDTNNTATLSKSIGEIEQKIQSLKNIERAEGFSNNWIKEYANLKIAIRDIQSEIKIAKKLEQQDTSSGLQRTKTLLREINDSYNEAVKNIKLFYKEDISERDKSVYSNRGQSAVSKFNNAKTALSNEGLLSPEIQERIRVLEEDYLILKQNLKTEKEYTLALAEEEKQLKQLNKEQQIKKLTSRQSDLNKSLNDLQTTNTTSIQRDLNTVQGKINNLNNFTPNTSQWKQAYIEIDELLKKINTDIKEASQAEKEATKSAQQRVNNLVIQTKQAYKGLETEYKNLYKSNTTDKSIEIANSRIAEYQKTISTNRPLLEDSGLDESTREELDNLARIAWQEKEIAEAAALKRQEEKDNTEAIKQQKQEYDSLKSSISQYISDLNKFNTSNVVKRNNTDVGVQSQVANNLNLIEKLNEFSTSLKNDSSAENVNRIKEQFDLLAGSLDTAVTNSQKLDNALKDTSAIQAREAKIKKLQNQMAIFASTNGKAVSSLKTMGNGSTFAGEWQQITEALKGGNLSDEQLKRLTERFQIFKGEAKSAGLTTERFFSGMGNQLKMLTSRWLSLYAIIGKIKSMIDNVKSLDTAMVNLRRVTTGTAEEYQKFLETAQISARNTYSSWSDTVEQASRWAKAGYSLEESAELAKTSLIYSKVGDVDNTTAVSDLVTVLRGFNMEANDSLSIVDKLDILNNKYATDAKSLGEALTVSSSAMATAGNSLDQTLALITGGTEITQNAKEMGTALRTISMRIRSMKGQLEELGEEYENVESVSKIQTQILNLTKGKVNIFDSNNNFRSTYDILKDISEIYETLSDPDKATLSEILFGKTRGNQGLAIINAFRSGQIGKAFTDAVNSAGTATDEMGAYAKGMEAHIGSFKERIEELSGTMFKSNGLKFYIDLGTQLISILTEATKHIGLFGTAVTAVVGAMTFKGVNPIAWWKEYSSIPKISEADAGALRQYNNLLSQGTEQAQARSVALANSSHAAKQLAISANGAAVSEDTLSAATNKLTILQRGLASAATIAKTALLSIGTMAIMAGITAVINAFSKGIDKAKEAKLATEESREDAVQTAKAYEEEANKLSGIYSKYINLIATTQDLSSAKEDLKNIQQEVNDSYDNEAKKIDLVNGNIAENIKLLREQQKVNAEKQVKESQGRAEVAEQNLQKETTYKFNATGLGSILFDANGALAKAILDNDIDVDKYTQYNEEIIKSSGFTDFYITGTLKKQIDVLTQIRDIYADIDGHSAERLNQLDSEISKLQTEYDQEKKIVDQHETDVANAESFANPEIAKGITDIAKKYQDFQSAIEKGDISKAFDLKDEIESTKDSLVAMSEIGSNDRDTILGLFDSFDLSMEKAKSSLAISMQEIQSYIDDSFGSSFEQLDKIDKAVQTLTDGDLLSSTDAWNLMDKIDSDGILKDIEVIGGKYKMSTQELITLRNSLISQQLEILENDKKEAQESLKTREQDLKVTAEKIKLLKESGINSSGDTALLNSLEAQFDAINGEIAQGKTKIVENEYVQQEFNNRLNITLDLTKAIKEETDKLNKQIKSIEKEISALETETENYLKAQQYVIDSIVKNKEEQKKILENEKANLQSQLDILEKQKNTIEKIVSDYDTAVSVATNTIKSQIDQIEKSRQDVEDYYDGLIDKLRTQNEEREDAIEYAEKLANLENAKNNKVRTYSSSRGWEWVSDKSAVQSAQNDLDNFNSEQQIKKLETEKSNALAPYNQQISDFQKYSEAWQEVSDIVKDSQNTITASQILGSDWHERIVNKDIQMLDTFRTAYVDYNDQLNTLNNVDISALQAQISLKEDEIANVDNQISSWNDYKSQVENTASSIKESLEDYMSYLGTVTIEEDSSLEQRENNLANFTAIYQDKVSALTAKQEDVRKLNDEIARLEDLSTELSLEAETPASKLSEETNNIETKSHGLFSRIREAATEVAESLSKSNGETIATAQQEASIRNETSNKVETSAKNASDNIKSSASELNTSFENAQTASESIKQTIDDTANNFEYKISVSSSELATSAEDMIESLNKLTQSNDILKSAIGGVLKLAGFASGGVTTSTGVAMLHGTQTSPEVIFNAQDASKLYSLVHGTSNLGAEIANKISLSSAIKGTSVQSGDINFNFSGDIKTDSPANFMGQLKALLDNYMDNYWITKLSESRVR